jgi:hypothetical protein
MGLINELHQNIVLLRTAERDGTHAFREVQQAFIAGLAAARTLCQAAPLAAPRVWSAPALLEMLVADTGSSSPYAEGSFQIASVGSWFGPGHMCTHLSQCATLAKQEH